MNKTNQFCPEVRERAALLVQEHQDEYPSRWVSVESIACKISCVPQNLLGWVKRYEAGSASVTGSSSSREHGDASRQRDTEDTQCVFRRPELDRRLKN